MRKLLEQFWRDERGCVPATEWMFVASILTLGTIAGMLALQHWDAERDEESPSVLLR